MTALRRLRPHLGPARLLGPALWVLVPASLLPVVLPRAIGWAFDRAILAAGAGEADRARWIWLAAGAVLAAQAGLFLCAAARDAASGFAGERIASHLRRLLWARLHAIGPDEVRRRGAGAMASRLIEEPRALQALSGQAVASFFAAPLTIAAILGVLVWLDPALAPAALAPLPLLAAGWWAYHRRMRGAREGLRETAERLAAFAHEQVEGMEDVALARREADRRASFDRIVGDHEAIRRYALGTNAVFFAFIALAASAGTVAVLLAGGLRAIDGGITPGGLVAYLAYLAYLYQPAGSLLRGYAVLHGLEAAAGAVLEVVESPAAVRDGAEPVPAGPLGLEWRAVEFGYDPAAPVLRGATLSVGPGERVGLTGPTGSGKSTMARLAVRLADPRRGEVLVGGVDAKRLRGDDLRRAVGVVPQSVFLFTGTVRENVAFARPEASDAEIRAAMEAAACDLAPERRVEPGLSAGERQRIGIARALLAGPRVLILDEATGALDEETERRVLDGVFAWMKGGAVVAISHRSTALARCARVARIYGGVVG